MSSGEEPVLARVFQYLRDSKPFTMSLFTDTVPGKADHAHFFTTGDINRIVSLIDAWGADPDAENRTILCVRANIGDGKTSLLGYLRHRYSTSLVVSLDDLDQGTTDQ